MKISDSNKLQIKLIHDHVLTLIESKMIVENVYSVAKKHAVSCFFQSGFDVCLRCEGRQKIIRKENKHVDFKGLVETSIEEICPVCEGEGFVPVYLE